MKSRFRPKLSYSNVIASIALFVALGGAAVAAGLPKNSVGPKQIKHGAVTAGAIRKGAVTSGKLAPKSVVSGKLGPNAVTPGNLGNGVVTSAKIAGGAVIASSIKNGVITTNKLTNANVTTAKLADGSVTNAKLGPEVAPLLGTLKSGQTLRGIFIAGGKAVAGGDESVSAVSYPFPLTNAASATVLEPGATTANCQGLSGGNQQTPLALPGNLCIYLTGKSNLDATTPLAVAGNLRLGFAVAAKADLAKNYLASGQWAVTAP